MKAKQVPHVPPKAKRGGYAWHCKIVQDVKLKRGDTLWRCKVK